MTQKNTRCLKITKKKKKKYTYAFTNGVLIGQEFYQRSLYVRSNGSRHIQMIFSSQFKFGSNRVKGVFRSTISFHWCQFSLIVKGVKGEWEWEVE